MQLTLHMPVLAWVLVGILALAWIYVLLPDRFKPSRPSRTRYLELKHDFGPPPAAARAPAPSPWTPELLRGLDEAKLEKLIGAFWQARACNVESAGADLFIYRPSTGRMFGVAHCQRAGGPRAGVPQIQALWDLVQARSAPLGLYYGLSGFAPEALAFAKDKHLKLVTASDLLAEIAALKPEQQQALMQQLTARELAAAA